MVAPLIAAGARVAARGANAKAGGRGIRNTKRHSKTVSETFSENKYTSNAVLKTQKKRLQKKSQLKQESDVMSQLYARKSTGSADQLRRVNRKFSDNVTIETTPDRALHKKISRVAIGTWGTSFVLYLLSIVGFLSMTAEEAANAALPLVGGAIVGLVSPGANFYICWFLVIIIQYLGMWRINSILRKHGASIFTAGNQTSTTLAMAMIIIPIIQGIPWIWIWAHLLSTDRTD